MKGGDVIVDLDVTLEEMYKGNFIQVKFTKDLFFIRLCTTQFLEILCQNLQNSLKMESFYCAYR